MKKLLVAAIGAVAAYGASAGSISEQRFENVQGGLPLSMTISDLNTLAEAQTQAGFWSGDEITNKYTAVTASGFPQEKPLGTPTKALKVETKFGNPLSLNAIDGGTATNIPASGIYFDSLVKFTVCDGDGMPELNYDNAKIVMWLQENEELHKTNVMVRAGYINSDYTCTTNDYVCNDLSEYSSPFDIEQYHRVTIKTWASIFEGRTVPGFAIYVDNTIVNIYSGKSMAESVEDSLTEAAGHLGASSVFPSLVQGNTRGVSEISTVAFDGTGYITDLVFTDEAPFDAAEDWVEPKVAFSVGGISHPEIKTIEDAFDYISTYEGASQLSLQLSKDVTIGGTLTVPAGKVLRLDFNGKVITYAGKGAAISNVGGTLTITNSADVVGGIDTGNNVALADDGNGALYITAGNFWGSVSLDAEGAYSFTGGAFKFGDSDFEGIDCIADGMLLVEKNDMWEIVGDSWDARLGDADAVDGAYTIDDEADLIALKDGVAAGLATAGLTFKQTADIALTAAWEGIGIKGGKDIVGQTSYNEGAFRGTFDGQNHTISNFVMENGTDYGALFNSIYQATVKNLKISWGSSTLCANASGTGGDTGATFVGVAKESTLQNLTALAGTVTTVSASKDMGGIVGYLMAGSTVDSCTNELNVASLLTKGGRKCGGIAIITQAGSGTAVIRNCKNSGTVTAANKGAYAGYIGVATEIDGCENTAAVQLFHFQSGSVTASGVNKGNATVASNDKSGGVTNLYFATVTGDVATFVADNALAAGNTYKVMSAGATATFAFAEAGTIAFDTALATPTYNITAPGLTLSDATSGTVTTYTAAEGSSWPQPSEDTPAAVDTALAEDGFSTGTGVVTNKVEYDALIAYVAEKTSATSPEGLTPAQKANAVLCYALQAASIPATEITQEDITIDALATGDNGAVDLTVAIDGVVVGSSVPAATLAKIVTAKGGTALNAMSTENVTVNGHVVQTGRVKITVTPNADSPTSFFTTVIINK